VVDYLYSNAVAGGFTRVQSDVDSVTGVDAEMCLATVWYASGDKVVSVGLAQPCAAGKDTLAALRDQTVKAMRAVLPPS
jgi:hypothetical protein